MPIYEESDEIEALARFLNLISQNETHYDNCTPKIQKVYRLKAIWILHFLRKRRKEKSDGQAAEVY